MKRAPILLLPFALACHCPQAVAPTPTHAQADPVMESESLLWLRIEPATIQLAPGATTVFRPSLNYPKGVNYLRPPVKWSVQEGDAGGTVDIMGRYTAPSATGTYHVVVERTDAKGVRAIATVTVQ
ncbi:MAG TPA: hypothetical protein VFF76_08760 [Holophagaceae bacterium]|jgi:hypothetical protein|nr:hypothetical protein [Holophagaceae bacterium]